MTDRSDLRNGNEQYPNIAKECCLRKDGDQAALQGRPAQTPGELVKLQHHFFLFLTLNFCLRGLFPLIKVWLQPRDDSRCVHAGEVNLHRCPVSVARFSPDPAPIRLAGYPHKRSEKIIMRTVTYNDQDFDFETAFQSMDKELTSAIQGTVATDQEFFDSYLTAHAVKYGERFTVS